MNTRRVLVPFALIFVGACEASPEPATAPATAPQPPQKAALHVPQTPELAAYVACTDACFDKGLTCQGPAPLDPGHESRNQHCQHDVDACKVRCGFAAMSPGNDDVTLCADCITPCKEVVQHDSDDLDSYRILACMCECKRSRGGCGSTPAALDACIFAFTPR
jgi:hypothetical protein